MKQLFYLSNFLIRVAHNADFVIFSEKIFSRILLRQRERVLCWVFILKVFDPAPQNIFQKFKSGERSSENF